MPPSSHRPPVGPPQGSVVAMLAERTQVDFELAFYSALLGRVPDYADVLLAHSGNLTAKGMAKEGLSVDQALVELRPDDPDVRYNLACRYALLKQPDLAVATLRTAIELGYRDFRYMIQDRDLEAIRKDPRFRALLREFAG
jgi:Flp pilus assembly protein TadD